MAKEPAPFTFIAVELAEALVRAPEHVAAGWQPEHLQRLTQTLRGEEPRQVARVPAEWLIEREPD